MLRTPRGQVDAAVPMEKHTPGMIRRWSRVSRLSMFTPLPWTS